MNEHELAEDAKLVWERRQSSPGESPATSKAVLDRAEVAEGVEAGYRLNNNGVDKQGAASK
jgi:hypothetical protein